MLIAVVAALGAAGSFAIGGVLQQRAASARPEGEALSFRLILDLLRQRMWLLGIGFAFVSYALEGVALSFGPLVLVQPLIVTELLFALPISIRWRGMKMSPREWMGTVLVGGGLTLGLVCAAPTAGRAEAPVGGWILALGVAAAATAVAVAIGRGRGSDGPLRSSCYALGAAFVFGSQAALFKATVARFEHGLVPALESWEVYAMSAAAILGLLLVQSAYESGPLAASMPVVDAVDPAVAVIFGITLFHEHIRTGPWLAGITAGIALLLTGILLLDTSPLIHCLQKIERQQRAASAGLEAGASSRQRATGLA
ncbi:MAG TPA: DMT family transporter [Acidimicrobiales bacterium]|nr:DMT family transporter [Acidimicrobiales bacterium]